ncbi:MAG: hypothetical protein RIG26_03370 [Thalassospira sp.]|uniref:hypothetical protein n=1 Tax=Thalassospira sp. TaxID=1912094 RepID=UPI0032EF6C5C
MVEKMSELLSCIREEALRRYHSFDEPNFSFVEKTHARNPYINILNSLEREFDLDENTDVNDDVCFSYFLSKSQWSWLLQLSMVGRYSILKFVSEANLSLDIEHQIEVRKIEQSISEVLIENGIVILSKEIAQEVLVPENEFWDDGTVYQLLFSDLELFA